VQPGVAFGVESRPLLMVFAIERAPRALLNCRFEMRLFARLARTASLAIAFAERPWVLE